MSGWWLLFDASAMSGYWQLDSGKTTFAHYLPGIASTIGLIILMSIPASSFDFNDVSDVETRTRLAIFIGFLLSFSGMFSATYVMIASYLVSTPAAPPTMPSTGIDKVAIMIWPGVAIFLQNMLIFVSLLMMRFARRDDKF